MLWVNCTEKRCIERYGSPEVLVSDGGGVFKANQAKAIYRSLGISKEEIKRRRPWQNFIETTLTVPMECPSMSYGLRCEPGRFEAGWTFNGIAYHEFVKGHTEVGASDCPGSLMKDFVIPYRSGKNPGGEPKPEKGPEYAYLAASNRYAAEVARAAWHGLKAAGYSKALMATADGDVRTAAEKALRAKKDGRVCLVIGVPTVKKLSEEAREALKALDPPKEWRAGESSNLWNCVGNSYKHTKDMVAWRLDHFCDAFGYDKVRVLAEYRERSDRLTVEPTKKRGRFGFIGAPRFTADELLAFFDACGASGEYRETVRHYYQECKAEVAPTCG